MNLFTPKGAVAKPIVYKDDEIKDISFNKLRWIDIVRPTKKSIDFLEKEFGFHELLLEDCLTEHQRPKIPLSGADTARARRTYRQPDAHRSGNAGRHRASDQPVRSDLEAPLAHRANLAGGCAGKPHRCLKAAAIRSPRNGWRFFCSTICWMCRKPAVPAG